MIKTTYKPIVESEYEVTSVYSICIDKCIKYENGVDKGEQVVMRYKKNGQKVPRQPAFDEMSMTKAIIKAYRQGVFSNEALQMLKQGIDGVDRENK